MLAKNQVSVKHSLCLSLSLSRFPGGAGGKHRAAFLPQASAAVQRGADLSDAEWEHQRGGAEHALLPQAADRQHTACQPPGAQHAALSGPHAQEVSRRTATRRRYT